MFNLFTACTGDPLGPKNGFKCFQVAQFFRDSEEFLGCKGTLFEDDKLPCLQFEPDVHGNIYHKYQVSVESIEHRLDP